MLKFSKQTIFLSNLKQVNHLLRYNKIVKYDWFNNFCNERYIIRKNFDSENNDDKNVLRIWKTNTVFDYWYDNYSSQNFIASLYYIKKEKEIKIDYLDVNDSDYPRFETDEKSPEMLDDIESKEIVNSLIEFLENIAKKEKKEKIIIDVHKNLYIYNKYYSIKGFVVTNRQCNENRNWFEAELKM
jgi:hypothetical protein